MNIDVNKKVGLEPVGAVVGAWTKINSLAWFTKMSNLLPYISELKGKKILSLPDDVGYVTLDLFSVTKFISPIEVNGVEGVELTRWMYTHPGSGLIFKIVDI